MVKTVTKVGKHFLDFYFVDCKNVCMYRYGQLTVMVFPIVLTAGTWLGVKAATLAGKIKTLTRLGKALSKTDDVARLLVTAENEGRVIAANGEKIIIRESDDAGSKVLTTIEKEDDNINILHRDDLVRMSDEVIENIDEVEEAVEKFDAGLDVTKAEKGEIDEFGKLDEASYDDPSIETDAKYRAKMMEKHNGKGRTTKAWRTQKIGTNVNHARIKDGVCEMLEKITGVTDIRINQAQTDITGNVLGLNRPDIQFSYNKQRYYIEIDATASSRGAPHKIRIQRNDLGANLARDDLPDKLKEIRLELNGQTLQLDGSITLWQFD